MSFYLERVVKADTSDKFFRALQDSYPGNLALGHEDNKSSFLAAIGRLGLDPKVVLDRYIGMNEKSISFLGGTFLDSHSFKRIQDIATEIAAFGVPIPEVFLQRLLPTFEKNAEFVIKGG